jgi:hypothetical protein
LVGSPIIKYMYRKLMANKNPFQNSDVCKWYDSWNTQLWSK